MNRSIELRQLDCLVALVEESSVTRAADRCGMSQPRMSNALSRLRALTGDPLLVRAGLRMVPTERAIEIASTVKEGLDVISGGLLGIREFDLASTDRSFLVSMSDYVSALILPTFMASVATAAPRLSISTKVFDPASMRVWLERGDCDIAFGFFTNLGDSLKASVLFHDEVVVISRANHPSIRAALQLEEFVGARHAVSAAIPGPASTIEQLCDAILRPKGIERKVAIRVPAPSSVARIVAATDLLAIMPKRLADEYSSILSLDIHATPFDMPSFPVTMVWHERSHADPAQKWLRDQFRVASKAMLALRSAAGG